MILSSAVRILSVGHVQVCQRESRGPLALVRTVQLPCARVRVIEAAVDFFYRGSRMSGLGSFDTLEAAIAEARSQVRRLGIRAVAERPASDKCVRTREPGEIIVRATLTERSLVLRFPDPAALVLSADDAPEHRELLRGHGEHDERVLYDEVVWGSASASCVNETREEYVRSLWTAAAGRHADWLAAARALFGRTADRTSSRG